MVVVLMATGAFVYLRLAVDLNDRVDTGLDARASEAAALAARPATGRRPDSRLRGFEVADESFAQILGPDGQLLAASGGPSRPAITRREAARAARAPVRLERRVAGIDGTTRLLVRRAGPPGSPVVVVGQSLEDRDEALAGLVSSFAIGGPIAVILASAIGYLLASAGFRPMEAMRRRAGELALADEGEWLPLPVAHDEVRRLGETLNEMLDRMRRSFERERRFVADASHELRTPVAVVKTELEGALRTGDYGPAVREALVAAVEECDHLAQLAEDLLVLARAGEGDLPVRRESLPVRALLEGVRDRFADRARLHGRGIRIEVTDEPRASADSLRIRQALGNLVDNALRHGRGEIALSARAAAGGVELGVSDAGAGFAADFAPRAFERFTRPDHGRSAGGAGLGLAIVRAIAEAHAGTVAIGDGPGATVRLWLPGASPTAGPRPSQGGLS